MILFLPLCLALVAGRVEGADAIVIRSAQSARSIAPDDVEQSLTNWTAVWLDLLTSAGLTADTASESILESDTHGKLLILPNASNLSDAQLTGLQRHLDAGYGALMTWATATRDEHDGWRGWDFLNESTGGSIQTSALPAGKAMAFQMRGGVPGGCAIPPGYYMRFTPYVNPMFCVPGDSSAIGGYWTSDGFKDSASTAARRLVGVIVRQRPSAGRIVWLGANLDGLHVDSLNRVMAIKWARELFFWLNGAGVAQITPWPSGYRCGLMVHGDIEDQFDKVQRITSVFRRLNIPSTYNILTNEASRHPTALEAILSTKAELGIHGDGHTCFVGQSYELQLQRMNKAAGYISLHGPRPTSFRPPELGYDDNTLKAAKAAGITHFLADDCPDRDYPRYVIAGTRNPGAGLVFFPKSELDDYDLFVKVAVPEPSKMSDEMVREFNRINDEGGLYMLNYHSQFLAVEHFPMTIETTLKRILQHGDAWAATAEEIDQWIRQREGLTLTASSTTSTILVSIRNDGLNPVKDAVLRILPPRDVPAELMEAKTISQQCETELVDGAFVLRLPSMKPGANFSLEIGPSGGGGLSAKHKHVLGILVNAGVAIGGILILWLVFYLLFPKKGHYSQSSVPSQTRKNFQNIPKIDKVYPIHERPVKAVPVKLAPSTASSGVDVTGIRFEAPPKAVVKEKTVAQPHLPPAKEIAGIRFTQLVTPIDRETSKSLLPAAPAKTIQSSVPVERAANATPMIISAATVDEVTPKMKPIERSMKVSPARRQTISAPVRMKAPSNWNKSLPESPVTPESKSVERQVGATDVTKEPTEKAGAPAPAETMAPPARDIPDSFLQRNVKPEEIKPGVPVGKSLFFSPTGSRSTAILPQTAPAQVEGDIEVGAQQGSQSTQVRTAETSDQKGSGFTRNSVDVLRKRRAESNKPTKEEWR